MVAQEQPKLEDYRWAAVKGGRQALRMYGGNTSLTNDDADGESMIALAVCPKTFDPEKGRFGCYVKRAAFNAVRKLCLKHRKEPTAEISPTVESESDGFGEWLRESDQRSAVLQALQDPEQAMRILKKTRRVWLTVPQIATKIKISERKARRLCEQGRIPAVQIGWEWFAMSREVTAWRFAQLLDEYQTDGYKRIAARWGCARTLIARARVHKSAKTFSRREKNRDVVFFGAKKHEKSAQTA